MGKINRFLCQLSSFPIVGYQLFIRPILRPCCRYYPSCSTYALLALKEFGLVKGLFLSCRRILRCHPWSEGGYDPVLPNKEKP